LQLFLEVAIEELDLDGEISPRFVGDEAASNACALLQRSSSAQTSSRDT